MTAKLLESGEEIAAWLRQNIRSDFCLSAPYRRRWYLGGCEPTHFLATWPTDRLTKLGSELHDAGFEVRASPRGVHVAAGDGGVTVAAGRTDLGDGPPTEYALFVGTEDLPAYVTNSPEVLAQMITRLGKPPPPLPDCDVVQIGFPGQPSGDVTYVGSWQWDIHSEARTPEFIRLAAQAIVDAIDARKRDL